MKSRVQSGAVGLSDLNGLCSFDCVLMLLTSTDRCACLRLRLIFRMICSHSYLLGSCKTVPSHCIPVVLEGDVIYNELVSSWLET